MNRIITLLAALLLAGFSMEAQVTLSPLFSDNMVLQRDSEVPVWGKAKAGSTVKVMTSWDGMTHECIAGADGKWSVKVDTPPAGGPFEITISNGKGKKRMTVLHNVMSGDVWLCSGQSNMEMPVKGWGRVNDYEKELEDASNYPELRVLNLVGHRHSILPRISRSSGTVDGKSVPMKPSSNSPPAVISSAGRYRNPRESRSD